MVQVDDEQFPRSCYCLKNSCNACTIDYPKIHCHSCSGEMNRCSNETDMGELMPCVAHTCACRTEMIKNETVYSRMCGPKAGETDQTQPGCVANNEANSTDCFCKEDGCDACNNSGHNVQAAFVTLVLATLWATCF